VLGEPIPAGYVRVKDSELTPAMVAWAKQINEQTYPGHYGEIFETVIDGKPIAGIVEHHTYTTRNGQRVYGDFHGVSLLHPPSKSLPQPQPQSVTPKRGFFDLILIATTLTASGLAIFSFFQNRRRAQLAENMYLDVDEPYQLVAQRFAARPLHPGMAAKLVFRAERHGEPNERMWVRVHRISGNRIIGRLANRPLFLRRVRQGDTVVFDRRHVTAVET
jgi:hypothetical protein